MVCSSLKDSAQGTEILPKFDSKGTSGGCQAVYTVYQQPNTTLNDPPTCFNLTYPRPEQQLGVIALVDNGPFSQFGWMDQVSL